MAEDVNDAKPDAALREKALGAFGAHVKERGARPESIAQFCRDGEIPESAGQTAFPTLDALESAFWSELVERVADAIAAGAEWPTFTARQQLLTFLFTFFEEALPYRAFLDSRFGESGALGRPEWLESFEARYEDFVAGVIAQGEAGGEIADRGCFARLYPVSFYQLFRATIDFHRKDESAKFERTDAYIEKTVNLAFELLRPNAFHAALDLLRFILPARGQA